MTEMTKEEASNQLNDMKTELAEHLLKKDIEALDMAISALSENKGDLISRQAVLELVANYDLSMGQVVKGIHVLPAVENKGKWIPIEERKPKHRQKVFVTYETEDGLKVDKTEYHECHGFAISPYVTAWREDIKPYKAESEDKKWK